MKIILGLLLIICGSIAFGSETLTYSPPTYHCSIERNTYREGINKQNIKTIFTTEKIEINPGKLVEVDLDESNQISATFHVLNVDNIYNNEKWTIQIMDKQTRDILWCYHFNGNYIKRPLSIKDYDQVGFIKIRCEMHSEGWPDQIQSRNDWTERSHKCLGIEN